MQPETDPDREWVARLTGCSPTVAEGFLGEGAADRRLFGHIQSAHRRAGRDSYIEIDAPLEMFALVRVLRPDHVVEVGVSSGVSTAYLLAALEVNGRGLLHSVDLPSFPKEGRGGISASWTLPPGRGPGWAVPARLHHRWDLRVGDKRIVLPRLGAELQGVGLFVYDVPHDDPRAFLEFLSLDRAMDPGAVAIADHGPGGGMCGALRRWARRSGTTPVGRSGLGLYGFAKGAARRRKSSTGPRSTVAPGRRRGRRRRSV